MELLAQELTHEVLPGVLEKEWSEIEKKLESAKTFAKSVHIDILDGKFAENSTFIDPKPFAKYAKDLFLEVHMMVDNPISYLKPFADAGFQRFIGHVEKMPDISEFVALAQTYGEVGLGIDGPTDLKVLDTVNFDDIDSVTVMMIKAGFSGQQFVEEYLGKVKKLREKTAVPIEVDGGVKDTNILFAKNAGANRFVATSFIWNSEYPQEAFEKIQKTVRS